MYVTKDGEARFQVAAAISETTYEHLRWLAYIERTTVSSQVRLALAAYVSSERYRDVPPATPTSP